MKHFGKYIFTGLIILIIALIINIKVRGDTVKQVITEFGTSPGTLVQLASSHVPTESDLTEAKIEQAQVRKDIYDMTESDLY
jgi:hypothetical protein